jgi:esterase/lipase superfamily enzyme
MLIITNRDINKSNFKNGVGDHDAFGDGVNSKGPNVVRLATAKKVRTKWQVELIKEPSVITAKNIPLQQAFSRLREDLTSSRKNCVFFAHGFNQSFKKNLEKSLALEKAHGVEVIAFSWPSNPGGFKTKEYRDAKRTAGASVGGYLKEPFNRSALEAYDIKTSLMTYSLGNHLFQKYIVDSAYENETAIFDIRYRCVVSG